MEKAEGKTFMKLVVAVLILLAGITTVEAIDPPPPPPNSITIEANPLVVQADGTSYSTVVATVRGPTGPSPGATVFFNTNFGTLSTMYGYFSGKGWINITDAQGRTSAIIRSGIAGSAKVTGTVGSVPPKDITVTFTTQDVTAPVINRVFLNNTNPISGQAILVTVNATDNVGVTVVAANGASLINQGGNTWSGTITALSGTRPVNVSARDAAGNFGWNNSTSYTGSAGDATKPAVMNGNASPAVILNDNGRARVTGTNLTRINVTVTDNVGVGTVKINLSSVGGLANAMMTRIPGTDIYTITTNATAGINQTSNLVVNASDTSGNFNNSASIPLTVLRRGDLVRDNIINSDDAFAALLIAVGSQPPPGVAQDRILRLLAGDVISSNAAIQGGDGVINSDDAFYILRAVMGSVPPP